MKINNKYCAFAASIMILGLFAVGAAAKGKANHHDGQQLLGGKAKTNGHHVLHKNGDYTAAVDVKDGKIAGLKVSHPKKGDVPVKKYKTNKKMAQTAPGLFRNATFVLVQGQYVGTTYIGYSYINDYGDEEIYWFPYDMILDGDTGAVSYVPAY